MRRLQRLALASKLQSYLGRQQEKVRQGRDVDTVWAYAGRTKSMKDVRKTLIDMVGVRERCMYCEDSRGSNIDHYWPKSPYKEKTFSWINMILSCSPCNIRKENRFELDGHGDPLLIDPTSEDPWNFLYYETTTGNLTAKYRPDLQGPDPKGWHTTREETLTLNDEAVVEGRRRIYRNLNRAVKNFIIQMTSGNPDTSDAFNILLQSILDNQEYGLAIWYFKNDGQQEEPLLTLCTSHPQVWSDIIQAL